MKKVFACLALVASVISLNCASIDKKIEAKKRDLQKKERESKIVASRLYRIADKIMDEQKKLASIKEQISKLQENIAEQKSIYELKKKELHDLQNSTKKLIKTKKELERKLIDIVSKNFALTIISSGSGYADSPESIMADETFKVITAMTKKEFSKLKEAYKKIVQKIENYQKEIKGIQKYISVLEAKKDKLKRLRKKEQKIIADLEKEKRKYKDKLIAIQKEQDFIRKTLEKLNILKVKKEEEKKKNLLNSQTVRRIGSSYQESKTIAYRGEKTIAPLKKFVVKRKFGNYYDPIYKMKIFNESVILKPVGDDRRVRNILDGKVVFAKDTPMLDKVVVIEHDNGLHTIYAHISKISPTLKVGKKIKKGVVIGKVDNELSLEVTQKNFHIDPLELIRVN
ncbi:MAG: peptidoglycan DD-metalloendopeptidase family protein [Epsilonproteobacteria bacterium]|nr:peptidoglycan DD-metalloendopeptidase family protein [Campylobacterota bacterium]